MKSTSAKDVPAFTSAAPIERNRLAERISYLKRELDKVAPDDHDKIAELCQIATGIAGVLRFFPPGQKRQAPITRAQAQLRGQGDRPEWAQRSYPPDDHAEELVGLRRLVAALQAQHVAGVESRSSPTIVRRRRRAQPQSSEERARAAQIRRVIRHGSRGAQYSRELDNNGVSIPAVWKAKGCPDTYAEAYRTLRWRHQIQNEKYKLTPNNKKRTLR